MGAEDTLRQCPDCGRNLMQITSCKWISNLNRVEYEDVNHTYYCGRCEAYTHCDYYEAESGEVKEEENKKPPVSDISFDDHLAEQISNPEFALGFITAALSQGKDCFYDALKLVLEARKK
jgi:hypothetical protein